jgi:hypothetical protein
MTLSEQEKNEMLEDARSLKRRTNLRHRFPFPAFSVESYFAALDDLLSAGPVPPPRSFIRYTIVRL